MPRVRGNRPRPAGEKPVGQLETKTNVMRPNRRDQRAVRQPEPLGDMFRLSSCGLDVADSEWVDANETLTLMLSGGSCGCT
jgi:hypothetical protein